MLKITALIMFCIMGCVSFAYTIQGCISYTVDEARIIAFDGVENKIDISKYKKYFLDINLKKNLKLKLTKKNEARDRYVTYFSDDTYVITYKRDLNTNYYYNNKGNLIAIEYYIKKACPSLAVTYDAKGNLDSTCLSVSKNNQFVFDKNKKLTAHWIGNNGYNEKGELFGTRN